jgi:hypothetical protein
MSEGFIPYLERTRSYYSALGYPAYEWAHRALALFECATGPGIIATSPLRWQEDDEWKQDFMNIEKLSDAELRSRRADFERQKLIASTVKQV